MILKDKRILSSTWIQELRYFIQDRMQSADVWNYNAKALIGRKIYRRVGYLHHGSSSDLRLAIIGLYSWV
jgi:hypothetical protein